MYLNTLFFQLVFLYDNALKYDDSFLFCVLVYWKRNYPPVFIYLHTPTTRDSYNKKTHHILDVACSIMFYMSAKIFLGICYSQCMLFDNQLSSSTFHYRTPYLVLFSYHPLFSHPLGVCGCIFFIHRFSPNKDKLDPHLLNVHFLDTLKA